MKKIFTLLQTPKYLGLFVALTSAAALTAAYISQYGFGLDPCALCFYQRKPYFVNIALGLVAFISAPKKPKLTHILLVLSIAVFLSDTAIAAFHVGVEQHWWKGLESCSNYALPEHASVEELKKFIMSRSIVQCDVPAFVFLGISMAGYNFFLSLGLAATTLLMLQHNRKKDQTSSSSVSQ